MNALNEDAIYFVNLNEESRQILDEKWVVESR